MKILRQIFLGEKKRPLFSEYSRLTEIDRKSFQPYQEMTDAVIDAARVQLNEPNGKMHFLETGVSQLWLQGDPKAHPLPSDVAKHADWVSVVLNDNLLSPVTIPLSDKQAKECLTEPLKDTLFQSLKEQESLQGVLRDALGDSISAAEKNGKKSLSFLSKKNEEVTLEHDADVSKNTDNIVVSVGSDGQKEKNVVTLSRGESSAILGPMLLLHQMLLREENIEKKSLEMKIEGEKESPSIKASSVEKLNEKKQDQEQKSEKPWYYRLFPFLDRGSKETMEKAPPEEAKKLPAPTPAATVPEKSSAIDNQGEASKESGILGVRVEHDILHHDRHRLIPYQAGQEENELMEKYAFSVPKNGNEKLASYLFEEQKKMPEKKLLHWFELLCDRRDRENPKYHIFNSLSKVKHYKSFAMRAASKMSEVLGENAPTEIKEGENFFEHETPQQFRGSNSCGKATIARSATHKHYHAKAMRKGVPFEALDITFHNKPGARYRHFAEVYNSENMTNAYEKLKKKAKKASPKVSKGNVR